MAAENQVLDIGAILASDEGKARFTEFAKTSGFISKDDLQKHVDAQILAKTNGLGIDGVVSKNKELLEKVASPETKQAREAKKVLDSILSKTGAKEYNDLESFFDKVLNPEEPDDVRELKRNFTKTKDEYTKTVEQVKALEEAKGRDAAFIEKILKTDKLVNVLVGDYGCNKIQAEALSLYLQGKAQFEIIDRNGTREAVVKDSGLSIDEYLSHWAATEEARAVLPAKTTSGGGATGNSSGKGRPLVLSEAAKLGTIEERMAAYKSTGL